MDVLACPGLACGGWARRRQRGAVKTKGSSAQQEKENKFVRSCCGTKIKKPTETNQGQGHQGKKKSQYHFLVRPLLLGFGDGISAMELTQKYFSFIEPVPSHGPGPKTHTDTSAPLKTKHARSGSDKEHKTKWSPQRQLSC